ncbi:hypothetical protein GR28A_00041 [Vibrio phage vB_VcorM_GR28A]|nr:hypothetical protein GR28A_00041 [Vibrio phage vB_VcorM_GR28A]
MKTNFLVTIPNLTMDKVVIVLDGEHPVVRGANFEHLMAVIELQNLDIVYIDTNYSIPAMETPASKAAGLSLKVRQSDGTEHLMYLDPIKVLGKNDVSSPDRVYMYECDWSNSVHTFEFYGRDSALTDMCVKSMVRAYWKFADMEAANSEITRIEWLFTSAKTAEFVALNADGFNQRFVCDIVDSHSGV